MITPMNLGGIADVSLKDRFLDSLQFLFFRPSMMDHSDNMPAIEGQGVRVRVYCEQYMYR